MKQYTDPILKILFGSIFTEVQSREKKFFLTSKIITFRKIKISRIGSLYRLKKHFYPLQASALVLIFSKNSKILFNECVSQQYFSNLLTERNGTMKNTMTTRIH